MKIIIMSNRAYRSILSKLTEMEEHLKAIRPGIKGKQTGKDYRETKDTIGTGEVYIDGDKVCELLCISGRTLLRLCQKHQLNYTRVSHKCYYPLTEVEKLFAHRSIAFTREVRERLEREYKRLKRQSDNKNPNSHELS